MIKQQSSRRSPKPYSRNQRIKTEVYDNEEDDLKSQISSKKELTRLQTEMAELKGELKSVKNPSKFEDKLDQLMQEMTITREVQR